MAQQTIGLGAAPDDGNGDDLRTAGDKINDNFTELYTPACFKAHKNGSDQTGVADNVSTAVTFGTEAYDIGGFFASNGWTPPAGKVSLAAHYHFTGTISAGAVVIILLMKDGSPVAQWNFGATASQGAAGFYYEDVCTGSNVYTVNAQIDLTSGTATILGAASLTYFCGHWISA